MLRVFVAAVLAIAADAVLVANHLQKLGAHLATALARLHMRNVARRNSLKAGNMRETKGGKELRNVRKSVSHFGMGKQEMPVAFACVSQTGEPRGFMTSTFLEQWAPRKARWLCAGVATK
jgi:hypothetical protein